MDTSQQLRQPSLGLQISQPWRIRRADVDHDIIPNVIEPFESEPIVVKSLIEWCVGVLAKVHTYGDAPRYGT
jgi:hypothetical protein